MVSRQNRTYTKILLLLYFCFYTSSTAFAIRFEDRYIMKTSDKGQLYFIMPYKIPAITPHAKALSADITHLVTTDSVTMNISIWAPYELQTDSICLVGEERVSIACFQTFFIEKDGKLWLHRYSLRYPIKNLMMLYENSLPITICVYAPQQTLLYGYSQKKWNNEREWMNKILHIIASNKRLRTSNIK